MAELKYLTIEHLSLKYIIRVFSKIRVNPVTACWEWTNRLVNGYGQFRYGKTFELAHRFMFAWLVGPIPRGRGKHIPQLDHIVCNNRRCVNPTHLILKSPRENTMRSGAPSAINAVKTHCIHGHLLPAAPNTKQGSRKCAPCDRERTRKWRILHPYSENKEHYQKSQRAHRHRTGFNRTYSKKYR